MSKCQSIEIIGAYENNLKHINVGIPLNKTTVFVGASGSGKSTLVYDTLYRESSRAFIEHGTGSSRQKEPAKVSSIINLPAAFSVSQTSYNTNPRSTLGTYLKLSDYLRGLFCYIENSRTDKTYLPNDFSFNKPSSCCEFCQGTGETYQVDIKKIIPDDSKSLEQHALIIFKAEKKSLEVQTLIKFCESESIDMKRPFKELDKEQQTKLLYSKSLDEYEIKYKNKKNRYKTIRTHYVGPAANLEAELSLLSKPSVFKKNKKYLTLVRCKKCSGLKLKKELLKVKVNGLNISEVEELQLGEFKSWLEKVCITYKENLSVFTEVLYRKIKALSDVRLEHLMFSRTMPSLSGGELQRVRIADQLTNPLIGLLYIFDEPCQGLHPYDVKYIIDSIKGLTQKNNTVVAIEHNQSFIKSMDNVIYMGIGGGRSGGEIISKDVYERLSKRESYKTKKRSLLKYLEFTDISTHNLTNFCCKIPLNAITTITGVSGSGKSSLMESIHEKLSDKSDVSLVNKIYHLTQAPIHKNSRSTVATYLDVFEEIREMYSKTELSIEKNYTASDFSPNIEGGRCENCKGKGEIKIEIPYLDDIYQKCEQCYGTGYREEILKVRLYNKTIIEFLDTEIVDLQPLLNSKGQLSKKIKVLVDLGMGYIKLGQTSKSLSGGESQRVKLAKILGKKTEKNSIFLLDEPSAGLSEWDSNKLSRVLDTIVEDNTVVMIDHQIDFILDSSDYLIDLGVKIDKKESCLQGEIKEVYLRSSIYR